jgi:hypothetical protein
MSATLLLRRPNVMLLSGRICAVGCCVLILASGCGTIDVQKRGYERMLKGRSCWMVQGFYTESLESRDGVWEGAVWELGRLVTRDGMVEMVVSGDLSR